MVNFYIMRLGYVDRLTIGLRQCVKSLRHYAVMYHQAYILKKDMNFSEM